MVTVWMCAFVSSEREWKKIGLVIDLTTTELPEKGTFCCGVMDAESIFSCLAGFSPLVLVSLRLYLSFRSIYPHHTLLQGSAHTHTHTLPD